MYVLTSKYSAKISFKARTIAKHEKCIFCYHFGRHLEYLKMLNDAKVASVRFLTGKVWATRISKEKILNPTSRSTLVSAGLND